MLQIGVDELFALLYSSMRKSCWLGGTQKVDRLDLTCVDGLEGLRQIGFPEDLEVVELHVLLQEILSGLDDSQKLNVLHELSSPGM